MPRKKLMITRKIVLTTLFLLMRPSMKSTPSTSAMAPAVRATSMVPAKPSRRKRQVVHLPKNDQYFELNCPCRYSRITTHAMMATRTTDEMMVPTRT